MKRNRALILATLGSVLFTAAFLYLYYARPEAALGPVQPIPFSHNVHSGVKQIQCQYCHPYVAYSKFPGIPPVEKCLHCHAYIIPKFPWIQKEHDYYNTGTPDPVGQGQLHPRARVLQPPAPHQQPVACEDCHGEVALAHRLPAKVWQMGMCLECHHAKKASVDCWLTCHN